MRTTSIPFHSTNWVMKSIEMFSHGSFGINRGLFNLFFVYGLCALALNTSAPKMLYIMLQFKPIKFLSYGHPSSFLPTMFHHGHIMLLLPINASRTTLSRPSLWINSTSNNAKVSCHLSCFDETFGYVSKYHKEMLSM